MNSADPSSPSSPASLHPTTSRLAVASLVLGIFGFLVLPALAGLVCGVVAVVQISRSAGALKGTGIAVAGAAVSGVMLVFVPILAIFAAILLPALAKAKAKAQTITGMNNVKQITLAMHMYADDSKNALPGAANWCDALKPYLGGNVAVFRRPGEPASAPRNLSSYGYNARLADTKVADVNPATVMVFEMQSGTWNTSGGPELLRRPARPGDPIVIGFADGHAEAIADGARLDRLRWEP